MCHSVGPICPFHGRPVSYFCQTCNCALCPDCCAHEVYTGSDRHRGHALLDMATLLECARTSFNAEVQQLWPALDQAGIAITQLHFEAQRSHAEKVNTLSGLSTAARDLKSDFEKAVTAAKQLFVEQLGGLHARASDVLKLIDEAELLLASEDFQVCGKFGPLMDRIAAQVAALRAFDLPPARALPAAVPPFRRITISIPDLPAAVGRARSAADQKDAYFYSDVLKAEEGIWRAKVFPSGTSERFRDHLAVFLELLKGPPQAMRCVIRLTISGAIVRECQREFLVGNSWGWEDAAEHGLLSGGPPDLTIAVDVRPATYKVLYDVASASYAAVRAPNR
jgi:tripartite motif-containing protein 37